MPRGSVGGVADRPPFVSFLSDYGRADEFVGVCHAVMLDIAPELRIVDITHDVPAVRRARRRARARARGAVPARGVVLAVVDPGVGTDRRCIAVEVENGFSSGPTTACSRRRSRCSAGPRRIVALTKAEYQLPAPGPTFAGRDVMAPAAAHLAAGVPIDALGPRGRPGARSRPGWCRCPNDDDDGTITGEVLWVDRFGNCQLNVAPEQLEAAGAHVGDALEVTVSDAAGDADRRAGPAGCTRSPTPSRRSSWCSSTPTACARSRSTAARPPPSSSSAPARHGRRSAGRPDERADPRWGERASCSVALLVSILGAA